jgi:hypothetical protein
MINEFILIERCERAELRRHWAAGRNGAARERANGHAQQGAAKRE